MTKMQKRAHAACEQIKISAAFGMAFKFAILWRRSPTWGYCPTIQYNGEKAAYASGCGYDKASAVLAEFLAPLAPEVSRHAGAGVSSVIDELSKHGWKLVQTYNGSLEDAFEIRKA